MRVKKLSFEFQIVVLILSLAPVFQASAQRTPRVVQETSDELFARLTKWQEPVFPPIARQARAGGPVSVELIIDEKGAVVSAQAVSGHPLLRAATVQAARAWRFKPAFINKTPVRLTGRITYKFPSSNDLFEGKTIGELEKQAREQPGSAEAHYELGVAYGKLTRDDEAVSQLTEAIRINPRSADAHLKLGQLHLKLGRLSSRPDSLHKALEAFTEAAQLDPNSSEASHSLGMVYSVLGDYEKAIEAFKSSLQVEDPIINSHFMIGKCYVLLNRPGEAVDHYQRGLAEHPDSSMGHFGLGEAYIQLEQYRAAIIELKLTIKLSDGPGRSNSHYLLGVAYLKSGDREAALKEYDILKKLNAELASQLLDAIKKSGKRSNIS